MGKVTLNVLAKVDASFAGMLNIVEEAGSIDTPLWSMTVTGNLEQRTASVVLARVGKRLKTCVPEEVKGDFNTMFGFSSHVGFAAAEVQDGYQMVYANLASVLVVRALHVVLPDYMGDVVADVSIRPVVGSKTAFSFKSVLPVCFDDPLTFGPNLTYTTLDVALGVDEEEELDVVPVPDDVPYAPPSDVSDSLGDVRGVQHLSLVDQPTVQQLVPGAISPDSALHDANIFMATAPQDKYCALAEVVVQCMKDGGAVLIIGDHPGSLGRALADKNVGSIGLDPENTDGVDYGTTRSGRRRLVRAALLEDDVGGQLANLGIKASELGAIVVDTGVAGEPAAVATARNLNLARLLYEWQHEALIGHDYDMNVFAQLRSAPLVECSGEMLMLPGTNRQGCEIFASIFPSTARPDVVERLSFGKFAYRDGRIGVRLSDFMPGHEIYSDYFQSRNGITGDDPGLEVEVEPGQWYDFIIGRYHVEAALDAERGFFDLASRKSRNAFELFFRLREGVVMDDRTRADARALYESGRVVNVGGIPPGLLRRVSSMRDVVAARFDVLTRYCALTRGDAPRGLLGIMADPKSGALLHRLSEVRVAAGQDVELAKYKRVLPYECMSILASVTFYRALHLYVTGVRNVVGRPMHTWELQYLLWSLTHFGTKREKWQYLYVKLEDLFTRAPTGRRPGALSVDDTALRTFVRKLDDVGKRFVYLQADVPLALALGTHFEGARKRSNSVAESLLPDRSRRRPSSVYSSGPPALRPHLQRPTSSRAIPFEG